MTLVTCPTSPRAYGCNVVQTKVIGDRQCSQSAAGKSESEQSLRVLPMAAGDRLSLRLVIRRPRTRTQVAESDCFLMTLSLTLVISKV